MRAHLKITHDAGTRDEWLQRDTSNASPLGDASRDSTRQTRTNESEARAQKQRSLEMYTFAQSPSAHQTTKEINVPLDNPPKEARRTNGRILQSGRGATENRQGGRTCEPATLTQKSASGQHTHTRRNKERTKESLPRG